MHGTPRERFVWQMGTRSLVLGERTLVMGIVNATPDSFSDGGLFASGDRAVDWALRLLDEGADIVDVGGESTRPGSSAGGTDAIAADEEQERVLPVVRAVRAVRPDAVISVDTYRAATARLAVAAGADIVNDVSGGRWDGAMAGACAALRCGVVTTHTRGLPAEWASQTPLADENVLPVVHEGLRDTASQWMDAGVERSRIVLDPGFGFGKRGRENWVLLREFDMLRSLGFPLMAGLSRKGFLGGRELRERDDASAAANAIAALGGAHLVRVHDVSRTRAAVGVADALRQL